LVQASSRWLPTHVPHEQQNTQTKEVKIVDWKVDRSSRKAIYIPRGVWHVQPSISLISWQQIIWNVGKIKSKVKLVDIFEVFCTSKQINKEMKLKVTWKDAKNHQHYKLSSTSWHHHRSRVCFPNAIVFLTWRKSDTNMYIYGHSHNAIKPVRPNQICQAWRHYGTNCHVIGKKVTKEFQRYPRPPLMFILEIC
jgi:hypothetical protein